MKKYRLCRKDYSWNPGTSIRDNSWYLNGTVDESVIVSDEIVNVTDIGSTNLANTFLTNETNVTRTVPMNSDDNNVGCKMDGYILHTFVLVIILLFIIAIIQKITILNHYHYTKHRSK